MSQYPNVPDEIFRRLKEKHLPIALVGASNDPSKYGYRILDNLGGKEFSVIPVNPKETVVAGIPAVNSVSELPKEIALINFVVPPKVSLAVLPVAEAAGADAVWFQDGSYDSEVLEYARAHFKYVVAGPCIMMITNLI